MHSRIQLKPVYIDDINRFWSTVNVASANECWNSQKLHSNGYGFFNYRGLRVGAHRLAYFIHYGVDPGNLFVCHKCDNPSCCNPYHLFLGDHQANMADCAIKGRNKTKLKPNDVKKILMLIEQGKSCQYIAHLYHVSRPTIEIIRLGRTWQHVGRAIIPDKVIYPPRYGEFNPKAKLNSSQVIEIRSLINEGISYAAIGRRYGMNRHTIRDIAIRRIWNHIV